MDDCHTFQLISADGTKLHARHWEASTPIATLAIVHGFGEHSARYEPMATHFTQKGVQVVAIDLRGHGRSDGKRGVISSYDDFRADLAALLQRAAQLHAGINGPLILFGHSMGGGVVLDYGLSDAPQVDAIIASAPLIALPDPIPMPLQMIIRGVAKILPRAAMKQPIDGSKVSGLLAEQRRYVEDALNHGQLGLKTAVEMIDNGTSLTENADQWSLPLLMMHSDQDQLTDFTASQTFGTNAKAEFHAFSNVEHEMHNDTSRPAVYKLMDDFIDRIPARA